MKTVTVRFFAAFREATACESLVVQTKADDARALFNEMASRFQDLQPEAASLLAINDELVPWGQRIRDGDVVLFFPPVAGG